MEYKYYIEMTYIQGETKLQINPENIAHFFIDNDYGNRHMPIMYAVLRLDKNFFDIIIKNAKNGATIITNIYKIATNDELKTKILTDYRGECSYFISNDYNYNKEIDYMGNENREDVYRQVHMGLMYKECIETNKQTNNTTVIDTTIMNAVYSYMDKIPLLIESFTYNETIKQLVVPPQDSLSKTIRFFNSYRVFYDTPYRFFIEPGCTYLISSSGRPVPKANEKYNTIIFTIHAITNEEANVLGMEEDDTSKCYKVDINVLDTLYCIDNDTCKTVNNISSIINPSKDNTLSSLGIISQAMENVNSLFSNITSAVSSQMENLQSIPSMLNDFTCKFKDDTINVDTLVSTVSSQLDKAIPLIQSIPEPTSTGGNSSETTMTKKQKEELLAKLNELRDNMSSHNSKLLELPADFGVSSNDTISCLGDTTNLTGFVNSITSINASDNINALKSAFASTKTANNDNRLFTLDTLIPYIDTGNNVLSSGKGILDILSSVNLKELDPIISTMGTSVTGIAGHVGEIATNLTLYKDVPMQIDDIFSNIAPSLSKLDKVGIDLKAQFTNSNTIIETLGEVAKSTLSNIISAGTSSLNSLKSSGLSLESLSSLQENINSIKDISQIGKLGISKFDVDLDFGTNNNSTGGTKIIRINDDNANMIKNIKAGIENKANKLTLNKNSLDTSVFTINKEYIIKNYEAHSNKDGRFILNRKVDIFLREDDKFLLNTSLEFDKLADESNGSTGANELGK